MLAAANVFIKLGRDKMAAISQTTFSNAFSWMKIFDFRFRFHFLYDVENNSPMWVSYPRPPGYMPGALTLKYGNESLCSLWSRVVAQSSVTSSPTPLPAASPASAWTREVMKLRHVTSVGKLKCFSLQLVFVQQRNFRLQITIAR